MNAASAPDRPQGSDPEQLPFSGGNSPSSSPTGQFPTEEKKPNFISRVVKPLQDFGFGKMAFMEGGVGLFVFAGIGENPPLTASVCWHKAVSCHEQLQTACLMLME